jgi:hypothetical protein
VTVRPGLVRTVTNGLLAMSCATADEVVEMVLRDLREQQEGDLRVPG